MSLKRVLLKATSLFVLLNLMAVAWSPVPWLARLSGYNLLFPGRERLPFGENPEKAYNFSLFQLDAMLRSHEIASQRSRETEYRIVLIGDSSVWGYLLKPHETLSAQLNRLNLAGPNGKEVHFYNLGYPTMSLTKDLLFLNRALAYQPDMVIWLVTLESFPRLKQIASPILQHNPGEVRTLINQYNLSINENDPSFVQPAFWGQTLVGGRRALADLIRLQVYGVMWAATGVDQYYPATYDPPQEDLEANEAFQGLMPPRLRAEDLALEVLEGGWQAMAGKPLLLVNEPIYLSRGNNSNLRYNFFYPRWAYDQYRTLLTELSLERGWTYLDMWDLAPSEEFTNSAIHLTPAGTSSLADAIGAEVQALLAK